jgi:hypothetical protein
MMFAVIARAQDFQTSCTQDGKQICRLSDLSLRKRSFGFERVGTKAS